MQMFSRILKKDFEFSLVLEVRVLEVGMAN